jgi:hypothetical protein
MVRTAGRIFGLVVFASAAMAQMGKPLATIPADAAGLRYEVSPGRCQKGDCTIVVRLMQRTRELDTQSLGTGVRSLAFKPTPFRRSNGAGDPLATSDAAQAFSSGTEEDSITVVVRPVKLTRELTGALIDLRIGFEHVKRRHAVFAAPDQKLAQVWSAEEGEGPTFSTTALLPEAQGRQPLAYFSFFSFPDDSAADKMSVEVMAYDAESRKLAPDRAHLLRLFAGPYRSAAEARAARVQRNRCHVPLWVLPSEGFQTSTHGFVVAVASVSRANIDRVSQELESCGAGPFIRLDEERNSLILW